MAIAAFGAFFFYITRPMWWEHSDSRTRDLAEAAYLERIAEDGPQARRANWLNTAMRLAARHGDWDRCQGLMAEAQRQGLELDGNVLIEIQPGTCWAAGMEADRWTRGTGSIALFLRNDGESARTIRTFWSTKRQGDGMARKAGAAWQTFHVALAGETPLEFTVAPGSVLRIEVKATEGMFEGRGAKDRGIHLDRVEVVS